MKKKDVPSEILKSIDLGPNRYTLDYRIRASILSAVVLSNKLLIFKICGLPRPEREQGFMQLPWIFCYNKCRLPRDRKHASFDLLCSSVFSELITYLKRAEKIKSLFLSHSLRSRCFTPVATPPPPPTFPQSLSSRLQKTRHFCSQQFISKLCLERRRVLTEKNRNI